MKPLNLKGESFNTSQGTQQIHLRKSCLIVLLHKNFWSLENNALESFFFPVPVTMWKGMFPVNVLKRPLPGQMISFWHYEITFATVHVTDDVTFYDGPGMLIHKTAKPCINSMWIALLIHEYLPVKTWLLKTCDTAFYALIIVEDLFTNIYDMLRLPQELLSNGDSMSHHIMQHTLMFFSADLWFRILVTVSIYHTDTL